ncbi:MAG: PQQ-like beta-propeller repeat protein [Planctomycetaceae bacterium]|nr:PQQ-like beta-propeller repeat protein [Planctomycetaceae bacterium]
MIRIIQLLILAVTIHLLATTYGTTSYASRSKLFAEEPVSKTIPRWPGFLGAGADLVEPTSLPLVWAAERNVAWKTSLPGQGQSSPVIWGDRVFTTSIEGEMKNECHITSIDLQNGNIVWDYHAPSAQPVRANYFQSRSAPTPTVDANRVYAFFETGKLIALTHEGTEVWTRNLVEDYGEFEVRIGLAASPLQTENAIIVVVDHEGPSYLLAVDKTNGETLWMQERFSRVSYASPALVRIGGQNHVVCSASGSIDGYDSETGKLLWTYEDVGGNRSSTPLPFNDGCFLIGASPGMNNEREESARKSNLALKVTESEGQYTPTVLWNTSKAMASFGSPMVHAGYAYWVNRAGVVYCFEAETGKPCYTKRLGQPCYATPYGIGDRVYFFGKGGTTTVLASGPEYKVLAENVLYTAEDPLAGENRESGEERRRPQTDEDRERNRERLASQGITFADSIQYGYAVIDGHLIIKTGSMLYCLKQIDQAALPSPASQEGE